MARKIEEQLSGIVRKVVADTLRRKSAFFVEEGLETKESYCYDYDLYFKTEMKGKEKLTAEVQFNHSFHKHERGTTARFFQIEVWGVYNKRCVETTLRRETLYGYLETSDDDYETLLPFVGNSGKKEKFIKLIERLTEEAFDEYYENLVKAYPELRVTANGVTKETIALIESLGGGEKYDRKTYTFAWDKDAANNLYKALKDAGFKVVSCRKGELVRLERICEDDDVVTALLKSVDHGTYSVYEVGLSTRYGAGTHKKLNQVWGR